MKKFLEQSKVLLVAIALLVFAASCGDDKSGKSSDKSSNDTSSNGSSESIDDTGAEAPLICLWKALSVRETPDPKGKYVTSIYMGEEAVYLGEKQTDDPDKKKPTEYLKVRLIDGKEGWVNSKFVVVNGTSYAFLENSKLYKRPDMLAAGKDDFDRLQYVVVMEEKDDWVRVKGYDRRSKWYRTGWVKKDKLTDNKIDVTVAVLFARALNKKTEVKQIEALQDILDNADFSESVFKDNIKSKIESLNMPSGDDMN